MNFWATRLNAAPSQAPVQAPPEPSQVQGAWFSNPLILGQQAAPQVEEFVEPEVAAKTSKARASRNAGICPQCDSGNYGRAGNQNTYERCYDCGYNDRFEQQAAGIPAAQGKPSAPSRQVASGGGHGSVNNFHPETIIQHI